METCYLFCDYNTGQNKVIRNRPPTQDEYNQVADGDGNLFKLEQEDAESIFITVSECKNDDEWKELPSDFD